MIQHCLIFLFFSFIHPSVTCDLISVLCFSSFLRHLGVYICVSDWPGWLFFL